MTSFDTITTKEELKSVGKQLESLAFSHINDDDTTIFDEAIEDANKLIAFGKTKGFC